MKRPGKHQALTDEEIVEGYTRFPQGGEFDVDEWGDLSAWADAAAASTMRALDEEEKVAGFDPW